MASKKGQGVYVAFGIIALIVIMFLGFAFFGPEGNSVDKEFLGGRITGSIGDIIGIPLFLGGIAFMVYAVYSNMKGAKEIKGAPDFYGSKGDEAKNVLIPALAMLAGIILFWNL